MNIIPQSQKSIFSIFPQILILIRLKVLSSSFLKFKITHKWKISTTPPSHFVFSSENGSPLSRIIHVCRRVLSKISVLHSSINVLHLVRPFQSINCRSICEYQKYDHYITHNHSYHLKLIFLPARMMKKVNIYILDYANWTLRKSVKFFPHPKK